MARRFSANKKKKVTPHGQSIVRTKTVGNSYWVWGKHTVESLVSEGRRNILNFFITSKALKLWGGSKLPVHKVVEVKELDALLGSQTVHQGVAVQISSYNEACWEDFISVPGRQCWVALDQVTDPHNVGAILRSAAVFGLRGMLLPKNNAPRETGIMAKTASGSIDIVPRCYVTNLQRTIDDFKKAGFWVVGLAEEGSDRITSFQWPEKTLLIMGSEGKGLRSLVKESCDYIVHIPGGSTFSTLNVSNAAAVCFYAWCAGKS